MEEISLFNFQEKFKQTVLKKAEKLPVRELDEEGKGKYISFIDDGNDSYDVALEFNAKGLVTASSCDCGNEAAWCLHKVALLLHIASNKKVKAPVKTKRKLKPYETLLLEADFVDLRNWVTELLENNHDLALEFVSRFTPKATSFTIDEVKKLNAEAVKSVVKARKKIESNEIKKIVDLFKKIHEPILEYFANNSGDRDAIQCFHYFIEDCLEIDAKFRTNSSRISGYVEDLIKQTTIDISKIEEESEYERVVNVHLAYSGVHRYYSMSVPIVFLRLLFDAGTTQQKEMVIKKSFKTYDAFLNSGQNLRDYFLKVIFKMVVELNVLIQYIDRFEPIRFDNDYNLFLIDQLVKLEQYEKAERYCLDQIKQNFDMGHSIPYYAVLKAIYQSQNREEDLLKIAKLTVEYTYDFEDYKLVLRNTRDEALAKKFRNSIYARSQAAARNGSLEGISFGFLLLAMENKWEKMLEKIDHYTPIFIPLSYFDLLFRFNKEALLEQIFLMRLDIFYMTKQMKLENELDAGALLEKVRLHYDHAYLKKVTAPQKDEFMVHIYKPLLVILRKKLEEND